MEAEIIAIGTELLLGDIVNSNAAYLSQRLAEIGIDVYHHSTVGDNPARIASAIKLALSRAGLVITTGGLGPTVDDVTMATVSKTVNRKLIYDKITARRIKNRFLRRHIKLPKSNLRQAYIPEGAVPLKNDEGTAPGVLLKLPNKKFLIALPGPPRELKPMFELSGIPLVKKISKSRFIIKTSVLKITGLPESKVCEKVKDTLEMKPPTTVGIYARLGEVDLKIMTKAKNQKDADRNIALVEKRLRARLGDYIFGTDNQTLEAALGKLFVKNKKTLAIAESCTGGLIASRITDVPGSSEYFRMGIVAYSNQAKQSLLAVPVDLLITYGAVSRQVAIKMARGIRKLADTDIGLAVTGIAGPGGATKNKPAGLVYIALSVPNKTAYRELHFLGDRAAIKWQISQAALDMLRTNLAFRDIR